MKTYAITYVGQKRSVNQDFYYMRDESIGILQNLYIVADGMGGHNAGDIASRFCVERFIELIKESKERTKIQTIEYALKTTTEELIAKANGQSQLEGMGTTFAAATLQED